MLIRILFMIKFSYPTMDFSLPLFIRPLTSDPPSRLQTIPAFITPLVRTMKCTLYIVEHIF